MIKNSKNEKFYSIVGRHNNIIIMATVHPKHKCYLSHLFISPYLVDQFKGCKNSILHLQLVMRSIHDGQNLPDTYPGLIHFHLIN